MNREKLQHSVGLRIAIIAGLTLALCIPALIIQVLIYEREVRRENVLTEIKSKWGESQLLTGPVLSVPVVSEKEQPDGTIKTCTRTIYLLPEKFSLDGTLNPELRYRGIYQILLYDSDLHFNGQFVIPDLDELNIDDGIIQYQDALLEFGLTDMKGIADRIDVKWNDAPFSAEPGIRRCSTLQSGFHTRTPLNPESKSYHFNFNIRLNGSETLSITPVGKETTASLNGAWAHPSFTGDFLPAERQVEDNSFSATWKILYLNRNFPHYNVGSPIQFDKSSFGVTLFYPADQYQKTTRTVKYAILFIGMTFLAYFLIEILNRKILHPIQYLLIGSALVLFYLILLSLAEHMRFAYAYILSSVTMISLITLYTRAIFKSTRFSTIIAAVLATLYGFLYMNLQLQDYALLFGSLGLFLILALIMYLTRNFDWFYGFQPSGKNPEPAP